MPIDIIVTRFVQQNVGGLRKDLAGISADMLVLESHADRLGGVGTRVAGIGAVSLGLIANVTKAALESAGQVQRVETGFMTVLRDAEKAKELSKKVREFDVKTPFSYLETARASQMLLAAGFRSDLLPTMEAIGNATIAAGKGTDTFIRALAIMSKIKTAGTITGVRVHQFAAAGINVKDILKKELGLTDDQMINIGRLHLKADVVIPALIHGLNERFKGGIELARKSYLGSVETLKGQTDKTLASIGKSVQPDATAFVRSLTNMSGAVDEFASHHPAMTRMIIGMGAATSLAGVFWGLTKSVQAARMGTHLLRQATDEDGHAEKRKARIARDESSAIDGVGTSVRRTARHKKDSASADNAYSSSSTRRPRRNVPVRSAYRDTHDVSTLEDTSVLSPKRKPPDPTMVFKSDTTSSPTLSQKQVRGSTPRQVVGEPMPRKTDGQERIVVHPAVSDVRIPKAPIAAAVATAIITPQTFDNLRTQVRNAATDHAESEKKRAEAVLASGVDEHGNKIVHPKIVDLTRKEMEARKRLRSITEKAQAAGVDIPHYTEDPEYYFPSPERQNAIDDAVKAKLEAKPEVRPAAQPKPPKATMTDAQPKVKATKGDADIAKLKKKVQDAVNIHDLKVRQLNDVVRESVGGVRHPDLFARSYDEKNARKEIYETIRAAKDKGINVPYYENEPEFYGGTGLQEPLSLVDLEKDAPKSKIQPAHPDHMTEKQRNQGRVTRSQNDGRKERDAEIAAEKVRIEAEKAAAAKPKFTPLDLTPRPTIQAVVQQAADIDEADLPKHALPVVRGQEFHPDIHEKSAAGTILTNDPERGGRIAAVNVHGYTREGRIVKKPIVTVYEHTEDDLEGKEYRSQDYYREDLEGKRERTFQDDMAAWMAPTKPDERHHKYLAPEPQFARDDFSHPGTTAAQTEPKVKKAVKDKIEEVKDKIAVAGQPDEKKMREELAHLEAIAKAKGDKKFEVAHRALGHRAEVQDIVRYADEDIEEAMGLVDLGGVEEGAGIKEAHESLGHTPISSQQIRTYSEKQEDAATSYVERSEQRLGELRTHLGVTQAATGNVKKKAATVEQNTERARILKKEIRRLEDDAKSTMSTRVQKAYDEEGIKPREKAVAHVKKQDERLKVATAELAGIDEEIEKAAKASAPKYSAADVKEAKKFAAEYGTTLEAAHEQLQHIPKSAIAGKVEKAARKAPRAQVVMAPEEKPLTLYRGSDHHDNFNLYRTGFDAEMGPGKYHAVQRGFAKAFNDDVRSYKIAPQYVKGIIPVTDPAPRTSPFSTAYQEARKHLDPRAIEDMEKYLGKYDHTTGKHGAPDFDNMNVDSYMELYGRMQQSSYALRDPAAHKKGRKAQSVFRKHLVRKGVHGVRSYPDAEIMESADLFDKTGEYEEVSIFDARMARHPEQFAPTGTKKQRKKTAIVKQVEASKSPLDMTSEEFEEWKRENVRKASQKSVKKEVHRAAESPRKAQVIQEDIGIRERVAQNRPIKVYRADRDVKGKPFSFKHTRINEDNDEFGPALYTSTSREHAGMYGSSVEEYEIPARAVRGLRFGEDKAGPEFHKARSEAMRGLPKDFTDEVEQALDFHPADRDSVESHMNRYAEIHSIAERRLRSNPTPENQRLYSKAVSAQSKFRKSLARSEVTGFVTESWRDAGEMYFDSDIPADQQKRLYEVDITDPLLARSLTPVPKKKTSRKKVSDAAKRQVHRAAESGGKPQVVFAPEPIISRDIPRIAPKWTGKSNTPYGEYQSHFIDLDSSIVDAEMDHPEWAAKNAASISRGRELIPTQGESISKFIRKSRLIRVSAVRDIHEKEPRIIYHLPDPSQEAFDRARKHAEKMTTSRKDRVEMMVETGSDEPTLFGTTLREDWVEEHKDAVRRQRMEDRVRGRRQVYRAGESVQKPEVIMAPEEDTQVARATRAMVLRDRYAARRQKVAQRRLPKQNEISEEAIRDFSEYIGIPYSAPSMGSIALNRRVKYAKRRVRVAQRSEVRSQKAYQDSIPSFMRRLVTPDQEHIDIEEPNIEHLVQESVTGRPPRRSQVLRQRYAEKRRHRTRAGRPDIPIVEYEPDNDGIRIELDADTEARAAHLTHRSQRTRGDWSGRRPHPGRMHRAGQIGEFVTEEVAENLLGDAAANVGYSVAGPVGGMVASVIGAVGGNLGVNSATGVLGSLKDRFTGRGKKGLPKIDDTAVRDAKDKVGKIRSAQLSASRDLSRSMVELDSAHESYAKAPPGTKTEANALDRIARAEAKVETARRARSKILPVRQLAEVALQEASGITATGNAAEKAAVKIGLLTRAKMSLYKAGTLGTGLIARVTSTMAQPLMTGGSSYWKGAEAALQPGKIMMSAAQKDAYIGSLDLAMGESGGGINSLLGHMSKGRMFGSLAVGAAAGYGAYDDYSTLGLDKGKAEVLGTTTGVAAAVASMFLPGAAVPIALATGFRYVFNELVNVPMEKEAEQGSGLDQDTVSKMATMTRDEKSDVYFKKAQELEQQATDMANSFLGNTVASQNRQEDLRAQAASFRATAQDQQRIGKKERSQKTIDDEAAATRKHFGDWNKAEALKKAEYFRRTQDPTIKPVDRYNEDDFPTGYRSIKTRQMGHKDKRDGTSTVNLQVHIPQREADRTHRRKHFNSMTPAPMVH